MGDTTFAPKGVFRWTEAGGVEILSGSEGLYPRGINQDGSLIIATSNAAGVPGSSWTRAQGFIADPNGRVAYALSADGSARAGSCSAQDGASLGSACYWQGNTVVAIEPPPVPAGSPAGYFYGLNVGQISADAKTVVGQAVLQGGLPTAVEFIWTKAGGTKTLALTSQDHSGVALSSNGSVLAAQRTAYTLGGATVVGTRALPLPSTPLQNPFLWLSTMSDDATTFVGMFEATSGAQAGADEAYLFKDGASWSPASMADRLIAHGVQLNGDRLHGALDVSSDGTVVLGLSSDQKRLWLATAAAFN